MVACTTQLRFVMYDDIHNLASLRDVYMVAYTTRLRFVMYDDIHNSASLRDVW